MINSETPSPRALIEQNHFYEELLSQLPDAILITNQVGEIKACYGNFEEIFGYKEEELYGQLVTILHAKKLKDKKLNEILETVQKHNVSVSEIECVHKDGSQIIIEARIQTLSLKSKAGWKRIGINRDITKRKSQEWLLRLQGEILELIATGAPIDLILDTTCNFVEKIIDRSLCSILLLDKQAKSLYIGAGPNVPSAYLSALDGLTVGNCAGSCGTAAFLGRPIIVSDVKNDPLWIDFRELAEEHNIQSCWSTPFLSKSGRVLGTFAISSHFSRSPSQFHLQVMKMAAHLTSIAVERKREEEAIIQTQKLESLGIMAGGIAHDFNNVLVAILGQSSIAQRKLPPNHSANPHIEKAIIAAEHAKELTKQMLAYSGRGIFEVETLSLNEIILDSQKLIGLAIPKHVQVTLNLDEALPSMEGDVTQLQQVVLNLLLNAAESVDRQLGQISVSTSRYHLNDTNQQFNVFTNQDLASGDYVLLKVKDNGCGIEQSEIVRIFDPFYSTKESGRGLGLSAVLGIVWGHNGGVHVLSQTGLGTDISIIFPIVDTSTSVSEDGLLQEEIGIDTSTIMVIDDEISVRDTVADMLELEGFQVILAENGQEGVTLFEQHRDEIDLIVLDLSMPGMSGEQTCVKLKRIDPDVKILLSSGYSETEVAYKFNQNEIAGFIQKPFQLAFFIEQLRMHLGDNI